MKKRMYKIMALAMRAVVTEAAAAHDSSDGGTDGSADNCICS